MALATVIISIVIIVIAITIAVIWAIKILHSPPGYDISNNMPFCINLMPEFTNGYAVGLETKSTPRKNGRTLVEFVPIDHHYEDDPDKLPKIVLQRLVIGRGGRVAMPSGDLSGERQVVLYMPKDGRNLSEKFRNTILGDTVTKATMSQKLENNLIDSFKEHDKALPEFMRNWAGGELSRKQLEFLHELFEEWKKNSPQQNQQQVIKEVDKK